MGSKGASPLEGDCCFQKKSENVEHRDFLLSNYTALSNFVNQPSCILQIFIYFYKSIFDFYASILYILQEYCGFLCKFCSDEPENAGMHLYAITYSESKDTAPLLLWQEVRKPMLRMIRQDRMLLAAGLAPFFSGLAMRFAVPLAESGLIRLTGTETVLAPYYALFDLFFACLTPAMFCFIAAMVMLEERDDHIDRYLFVTGLA